MCRNRKNDRVVNWHAVKASSFADKKDVWVFEQCKKKGHTDRYCFQYGDNGIGCWGDDTSSDRPMCALPPDDMIKRWGSVADAKNKRVMVKANNQEVDCMLADRMRWKCNIPKGHAKLDLNPGAAGVLALEPPFLVNATWAWSDDVS